MNEDNKRIARNTMFLYIRQFFILVISVYTSRVVLNALGATDFGLYNVVGGIIVFLSFITNALSNSASRYISYAIGTNNKEEVKRTFGSFLTLYYGLALLMLIIGETVGLWFVYNYLNIPDDRFSAALWVYHFSIITTVLNLLYVPYYSLVISHERMSVFAFISIMDAFLKLGIALLISISVGDKLIVYAALIMAVSSIVRFAYTQYCKKHFPESLSKPVFDRKLFSEILKYSGWILFGSLAYASYTQGLNVLLNIFFGPIVNAARGIAVQVQSATQNFIIGFQTAMYPQIIKSYAQNNLQRMHTLLHTVCKGSFFLFFILSIPFLFKTSFILELWLKNVPDYTVPFVQYILIFSMLRALTNEINHAVQATGRIKKFQVVDGVMGLSILPIAYISVKYFNTNPTSVFVILVIVEFATVIARIGIGIPQVGDKVFLFVKDVVLPVILTFTLGILGPLVISYYTDEDYIGFLLVGICEIIWTLPIIYFLGLNGKEKMMVLNKVKEIVKKKVNNS